VVLIPHTDADNSG